MVTHYALSLSNVGDPDSLDVRIRILKPDPGFL
jgi:hypothetical protein